MSPEPLPSRLQANGGLPAKNPEVAEVQTSVAMLRALQVLNSVLEPYMPLSRQPGKYVFEGMDTVVQGEEGKPFNNIGNIIMAARLIQRWEQSIGSDCKAKIETLEKPNDRATENAKPPNESIVRIPSPNELYDATFPHQPLSQPIAYAITLPKDDRKFTKHVVLGQGMLFIKENYLRRMELENLVYRQHLTFLEKRLYGNALQDISNVLGVQNVSSTATGASAKKIKDLLTTGAKYAIPRRRGYQPVLVQSGRKTISQMKASNGRYKNGKTPRKLPQSSAPTAVQSSKRQIQREPSIPSAKKQRLASGGGSGTEHFINQAVNRKTAHPADGSLAETSPRAFIDLTGLNDDSSSDASSSDEGDRPTQLTIHKEN